MTLIDLLLVALLVTAVTGWALEGERKI